MKLGQASIDAAKAVITEILEEEKKSIATAYEKADDPQFPVNIGLIFKPHKSSSELLEVECTVTYVPHKVKVKRRKSVSETQDNLFED
jgi:hypothetical protein